MDGPHVPGVDDSEDRVYSVVVLKRIEVSGHQRWWTGFTLLPGVLVPSYHPWTQ